MSQCPVDHCIVHTDARPIHKLQWVKVSAVRGSIVRCELGGGEGCPWRGMVAGLKWGGEGEC